MREQTSNMPITDILYGKRSRTTRGATKVRSSRSHGTPIKALLDFETVRKLKKAFPLPRARKAA